MKQPGIPRLFILLSITSFVFACGESKSISSSTTPLELSQAINNDHWIFSATRALPVYGRSRDVFGSYYVKSNKGELIVALPYYGQLNSPAGTYGGNPLDFHSTNFKLYKDERQNGEWTVTIESPDPEVRSMIFTFYDNGTAQLNIIMTNRSAISFNGNIAPVRS